MAYCGLCFRRPALNRRKVRKPDPWTHPEDESLGSQTQQSTTLDNATIAMAAYQIPSDVVVEILVRLPVKTLLCFKSVCKDWYTLLNSSLFIRLHLSKSLVSNSQHSHALFYTQTQTQFDFVSVIDDIYCPLKSVKLYLPEHTIGNLYCDYIYTIGSCNGLVCLCLTEHKPTFYPSVSCFLICNPSTRTFKFKPNVPFLEMKQLKSHELSYGFGYDGEHDDYKIVVTPKVWKESVRDDVYIYSCKADLWKHATPIPAQLLSGTCHQNYNIPFANNMLHYYVSLKHQEFINGPNYVMARFDLSSETWRDDLSFPALRTDVKVLQHGVLDGCLYVRIRESYCSQNVWIMKRCGDSWNIIIKYNIPSKFYDYNLVAVSKERSPRLLFTDIFYRGRHLFWYNPQDDTTEAFNLQALPTASRLYLCIASLVSIPGRSFNHGSTPTQLR